MVHRTPEEWARVEAEGVDRERFNALTDEDIERQAREDGMPIEDDDEVDPASIRRYRTPRSVRLARERMSLSQAEFASRFGLRLETVRTWEESGSDIEDAATLALLQVIEREPEAAARAFAHRGVA
jgi:putative transcriptional regulator